MSWYQVLINILIHVKVGLKLDPASNYKIVSNVPPYQCYRNGFAGIKGFKVQVGKKDYIEIPIAILKNLFDTSTIQNARRYNKKVFQFLYPSLYNQKPCFVNSVGHILVSAKVARQIGKSEYELL